jgi:uncharacterized protein (TIGR00255 family)
MPRAWQWLEPEISRLVRAAVRRGRVQVSLECKSVGASSGVTVDEADLDAAIAPLRAYAESRGIRFEPDASFLLRLSLARGDDVEAPGEDELTSLIRPVLAEAMQALVSMRDREGAALKSDLTERCVRLRGLVESITADAEGAVPDYRDALMQRLAQAGLDLDLSDDRVLKEIALFADRCDIAEELTRLGSHLDQFGELCQSDDPVGRTMEFLLQEISREINTVGSKSSRLDVARHVIEFKNELERIREQVQNVE